MGSAGSDIALPYSVPEHRQGPAVALSISELAPTPGTNPLPQSLLRLQLTQCLLQPPFFESVCSLPHLQELRIVSCGLDSSAAGALVRLQSLECLELYSHLCHSSWNAVGCGGSTWVRRPRRSPKPDQRRGPQGVAPAAQAAGTAAQYASHHADNNQVGDQGLGRLSLLPGLVELSLGTHHTTQRPTTSATRACATRPDSPS